MNTSTLPSTINKDKNASLPTCVKPPFSLRKKKFHVFVLFSTKDLSYFSAKNTILFSQQAQIPTEAGHLFCRHFSFVQSRVNDKHLGCGFKKNKFYIFLLPASQI